MRCEFHTLGFVGDLINLKKVLRKIIVCVMGVIVIVGVYQYFNYMWL